MARALPVLVALVCACTPTANVDGGTDAGSPSDAPTFDTAPCTTRPGELPGDRTVGGLLPALSFAGASGEVGLVDFHTPCAAAPGLLVVRVMTAWSARSQWHAEHTARLASPRAVVLDLLVQGSDAEPARIEDLTAWSARYDAPPDALVIDPTHTFAELAFGGLRLPLILVVDRRDLRVRRVLYAPVAGEIEAQVAFELSRIDDTPLPPPFVPPLERERFTEDEWDLLEDVVVDGTLTPPADASNAVAELAAAASLGATFFEDAGLSPAFVGCESCHDSTRGFTDGLPVAHGVADVRRNTPTLLGAAWTRWPFWDGRVDSLWAQALGPIENAAEMGSSRLFVAHRVENVHRTAYETVFGPLADLSDGARFPSSGAPGDASYDAMSAADRETVTRIFTNVGKAIEAYERSLVPAPSALDRWVVGDESALTETELDGLEMFVDFGCLDCHHGPFLTDDAFHAIGMPGVGTGASADRGRAEAEAALRSSPFRRTGTYSDDPDATDPLPPTFAPSMLGAFRTPTLRALADTAPYGHAGTFATIREVVDHYARVRTTTVVDPRVVGTLDPHVASFDAVPERIDPITAFLSTL